MMFIYSLINNTTISTICESSFLIIFSYFVILYFLVNSRRAMLQAAAHADENEDQCLRRFVLTKSTFCKRDTEKHFAEFIQNQYNSDLPLDREYNPFLDKLLKALGLTNIPSRFKILTDVPFRPTESIEELYLGEKEDYPLALSACRKRYAPLWSCHEHSLEANLMSELIEEFGINFEGFSSPFNASMKDYCSVFPEDYVFGSYGSFFDHEFEEGDVVWVNPPFTEYLLMKTLTRTEDILRADKSCGIRFVLMFPAWNDIDRVVSGSPYLIQRREYKAGSFSFHDCNKNKTQVSGVGKILYVLSNYRLEDE